MPPLPPIPQELWLDDLANVADAQMAWLWHGYLAPGNVTLLTSQWKSGKTTLLSVLLAKLHGGGELAGLPLAAGKAAVVTEESAAHWLPRCRQLGIGNHVCWFCRPFAGKPRPEQWHALLDRLIDLHHRHHLSLVAIDPLSTFFPGRSENSAEEMLEFLLPLQRLTALGLSILLLHHPNKGEVLEGQAARGSGALSGFADILLEMRWYGRASENDRRRRLLAFSRYPETPRQLVIEWTADGTDYRGHGDFLAEEFSHYWKVLQTVLADAPKKLTRPQITKRWLPDSEAPAEITLWRWLERASAQGLVLREGTGKRNDPYRYWLPGQEEKWKTPPWVKELEELNARLAAFADPPAQPSPPAPPGEPINPPQA